MAHAEYVARKQAPGYDKTRAGVKEGTSQAVLDEIKKQKDANKAKAKQEAQKQGGKDFNEAEWEAQYDKENKNFGEFDEAPGGGTPKEDGGGRGAMNKDFVVAEDPSDPKAIAAKERGDKVRYMQPRNSDGTFTYNSANGKGLSTNRSRGTTDLPWLAGIDLTFLKKGAVFKTTDPEMKRLLSSITLTASELHDALSIYLNDERGFAGIVGATITKKGRESQAEKTGGVGKVNQVDTSKMSENTQKRLSEAAAKVEKGPFRIGKPVSTAGTGAYHPNLVRKGKDRPEATESRNYSQEVSDADIKNYAFELSKQLGFNVTEEDVREMIDSGIIKTDTSGLSGSATNNNLENKIKKTMGLEDDD